MTNTFSFILILENSIDRKDAVNQKKRIQCRIKWVFSLNYDRSHFIDEIPNRSFMDNATGIQQIGQNANSHDIKAELDNTKKHEEDCMYSFFYSKNTKKIKEFTTSINNDILPVIITQSEEILHHTVDYIFLLLDPSDCISSLTKRIKRKNIVKLRKNKIG